MDDLDFIKQHMPEQIKENMTFRSSDDMLRSLMRGLRDEIEMLDSSITDGDIEDIQQSFEELKGLYTSYMNAQVRG